MKISGLGYFLDLEGFLEGFSFRGAWKKKKEKDSGTRGNGSRGRCQGFCFRILSKPISENEKGKSSKVIKFLVE